MDVMKKVPVREQAPDVRNKNFDEVCLGYNAEEAQEEATRCLNCKNAKCDTLFSLAQSATNLSSLPIDIASPLIPLIH